MTDFDRSQRALAGGAKSLPEYAEELRAKLAEYEAVLPYVSDGGKRAICIAAAGISKRLLAVEREINIRACI